MKTKDGKPKRIRQKWIAREKNKPTLTCIPEFIVSARVFAYLDETDLWRVKDTSTTFRVGFFRRLQSDCYGRDTRKVLHLASQTGVRFLNLRTLNLSRGPTVSHLQAVNHFKF